MAAEESQKENGAFGPKNMKLSEMGMEPIVVSAEEAVRYRGYSIGTVQPDNTLLIDNVADMNIKDFIDEVETSQSVYQRHKLDNAQDLNNLMLREIYDVNGKLMASNALKNAVAYDKAQKAYDVKVASMSVEGYEKNEADTKELEVLQQQVNDAKTALDYYTRHEKGTSYSGAVNDGMKSMLTSYDQAVALARKDLGAEFDKDIKKGNTARVKAVIGHYNKLIQTSEHYMHLKGMYELMNDFKEGIEKQRKDILEELNGYVSGEKPFDGTATIEAFSKASDVLEKYLNDKNQDRAGSAQMLSELNLENIKATQANIAKINPTELNPVIDRFNGLYQQALARLSSLQEEGNANMSFIENIGGGNSEVPFLNNIYNAIDTADAKDERLPDIKSIEGYEEWASNADQNAVLEAEKLYNRYRDYYDNYKNYEKDALEKINGNAEGIVSGYTYNSEEEYKAAVLEQIGKLSTGQTITDVYNLLIEETEKLLDDALEYVNKVDSDADPSTLGNFNVSDQNKKIEYYMSILDGLKTAKKISSRLHGQENFIKHSSIDEQSFVENMAIGEIGNQFESNISHLEDMYADFKRKSGLESLSSVRKSVLTGMLIAAHQAKSLLWMESLDLKIGTFITAEQKEALTRMVVTAEMMDDKNELTDAEKVMFKNGRKAIVDVMTVLHKHKDKIFGDSKITDKLYEPLRIMIENTAKSSTSEEIRMPLSFNSHDGKFLSARETIDNHETGKKEPKVVADVNEVRYVSAQFTPIEAVQNVNGSNMHKAMMENIVHYTNLLLQLDSGMSAQETMSRRKELYDPSKKYGVDVSTYEQENVEDSIIAFESGSRVLTQIEEFSNKIISKNNKKALSSVPMISNAIIIPGDYGTGKTKQVVYNALKILDPKKHKGGKVYFFSPSEKLRNDMQKLFNPDGKKVDVFNTTKAIETVDAFDLTKTQTWIIDEGSLLTDNQRKALVKASQDSGGKLHIIIMADMNQMRPRQLCLVSNGVRPHK